jgi:hypothetical protein
VVVVKPDHFERSEKRPAEGGEITNDTNHTKEGREAEIAHSEKAPMHVRAAALNDDANQLCAVGHVVWRLENPVQAE